MSCACTKTKPLNNCGGSIRFPATSVAGGIAEVNLYFKRLSDGKITIVATELDGTIPVADFDLLPNFSEDEAYEVWVTNPNASVTSDMEDRLNFVISSVNYSCLQLSFKDVYTIANAKSTFSGNGGAQEVQLA